MYSIYLSTTEICDALDCSVYKEFLLENVFILLVKFGTTCYSANSKVVIEQINIVVMYFYNSRTFRSLDLLDLIPQFHT